MFLCCFLFFFLYFVLLVTEKVVLASKKLISTSKRRAEHSFAGRNTQQTSVHWQIKSLVGSGVKFSFDTNHKVVRKTAFAWRMGEGVNFGSNFSDVIYVWPSIWYLVNKWRRINNDNFVEQVRSEHCQQQTNSSSKTVTLKQNLKKVLIRFKTAS